MPNRKINHKKYFPLKSYSFGHMKSGVYLHLGIVTQYWGKFTKFEGEAFVVFFVMCIRCGCKGFLFVLIQKNLIFFG